jgi:hypothetical protein
VIALPTPPATVVLGIDPGRHVGLAWVDEAGRPLRLQVVTAEHIDEVAIPRAVLVALGDGTGARGLQRRLLARGCRVRLVDERHSSEEARERYWALHPPRGWRRLLPRGLRPPPADLDAYAAWVIALRALAAYDDGRHPTGERPHDVSEGDV